MESVGLEERAGGGSRSSTVACVVPDVSILSTVLILGRSYEDVLHDTYVPMAKLWAWYSKLVQHYCSGRPLPAFL